MSKSICITGAAGYLSRELIKIIQKNHPDFFILATDILAQIGIPESPNFCYHKADIREADFGPLFTKFEISCVVHLASIVNPGTKHNRKFAYDVDVNGTENILKACIAARVAQIIVTSSGAAYGYYPDNKIPLNEDDPIRGNYEFAYAYHKRIVEEMLLKYRSSHPELKQLIFRPGTILGDTVSNQITDLFEKKTIPVLKKSDTPFVFIWDKDVSAAIIQGIVQEKSGIYNLAGDGFLTLPEIAKRMGHKIRRYPEWFLQMVLFFLRLIGKTSYGPEQTRFLAYRPVLSNAKLKTEFGYTPEMTSEEVFEYYRKHLNSRSK